MAALMPPYHVGIVVADLDAATLQLTEAFGVDWLTPCEGRGCQLLRGELVPVDSRFVYSAAGPPYLELLEQRPGTVWADLGLHHIGLWVDDMRAESDRLAALDIPLEAVGTTADGTWTAGCYHRTADGLRLELVDIAKSGPRLIHYRNGGPYA